MGQQIKKENSWIDKSLKLREDRAVVKLYKQDGCFMKSIIIPTVQYPLNGTYRVFHSGNTEELKDQNVLDIFNNQTYRIGHCYSNTQGLLDDLLSAGYNVKSYAGWLFVGESNLPIHHCWAVLDDNIILDLSDDLDVMYGMNGHLFSQATTIEEFRELITQFVREAKNQPNSVRCQPVGVPNRLFLYVGCECLPNEARKIYQDLIREFPNHECQRNCDTSGINKTQAMLKNQNLL